MPTGQTVVTNILTKLGLNNANGVPGAGDSVYVLTELNTMWDAWSVDEGIIYAVLSGQYPLTAFQQSYTIGAGATANFNTTRPSRIYKALVVSATSFTGGTTSTSKTITATNTTGLFVGQGLIGAGIPTGTTILSVTTNTSIGVSQAVTATASVTLVATGLNRNELDIAESSKYYGHNDLGASAATPDELYPDYNVDSNGFARLYVWPVANEVQPSYLEIEAAVPFTAWALGSAYFIPPAYQDAIEWTVAFRCLSGFGMAVDPRVAEIVQVQARNAEAKIREMNRIDRQLPEQAVMAPGTQVQLPKAA